MSARWTRALVALVRLYRAAVSPLLPPACRYTPTCSRYAEEAIGRFGPARGAWLALRRLLRCHPWGGRGWDPVPAAGEEKNAETLPPAAAGPRREVGEGA